MGKIANRQSLAFSERNQLSQAIPQFHVGRILHQRTRVAPFESQCNVRRVYEDHVFFRGRYDRQRTLVIRIAAITLYSDSAITIARFRPSKLGSFGEPRAPHLELYCNALACLSLLQSVTHLLLSLDHLNLCCFYASALTSVVCLVDQPRLGPPIHNKHTDMSA